jgi:hypothetical protein
MACSRTENRIAQFAGKVLASSVVAVIICAGPVIAAQNYAHPANKPKDRATDTTQTSVANTDPSRKTTTHESSGNRTVDKERVDILGANGQYQANSETEKETVQVDATTTRTVERTYQWDLNGHRNLVQVTEEDSRSTASGGAHVVSTTSNADAEGHLRLVQREVAETKKTSPNVQETKTTLYVLDGNGGLTPSAQTEELQKSNADHTVEVKTTTLVPTSSGGWQVGAVKESTIKDDGKNRTNIERISQADSEGRLAEVSRTVSKETENAAGEKNNTVETYSADTPGLARDGGLRLTQRVTTEQNKNANGNASERRVEQPRPGDPGSSLQVTARTKYTVQYGGSGTQQGRATQTRDVNGHFDTVAVETEKSNQPPAAQTKTASTDKPK